MPYVFAHPAAVIPLRRLLGKFAVPSALVIGSVIPDVWYFVPFLTRSDSHSVVGLFLFCLPAALFAYAAFHLIFKQPLLALLPRALAGRLGAWTCPRLPAVPWRAVVVSIAAGVLSHFAWDALTHPGDVVDAFPLLASTVVLGRYELRVHQLLQHGSTFIGTVFLVWWSCQKLRAAPRDSTTATQVMPPPARAAIVAFLVLVSAAAFLLTVLPLRSSDMDGLRSALRAAGITALSTLGLAFLAYCMMWRKR
ncbi:MAG TPA: DUF4184 family protein [Burkholderiales bacterium]|nr:DUF4184 family protein [Burkholderiales bacterium]